MAKYTRSEVVGISVSLILLFLLSVLLMYIPYNIRQNIISSHKDSLQILARQQGNLINSYLESQKEKQKILSSMEVFRELILSPKDELKIKRAKIQIDKMKEIIPGISLVDDKGYVILGEIDLPGTYYGNQPYFKLKEKTTVFDLYDDPLRMQKYYAVVGPVVDAKRGNMILGELAYDLELNKN